MRRCNAFYDDHHLRNDDDVDDVDERYVMAEDIFVFFFFSLFAYNRAI